MGSEPEERRFRAARKRNFLFLNLAALLAFYLLWGLGCGRDGEAPASVEYRDGVEIVHNATTPLHPDRSVAFEEDLSIGPGNASDAIRLYMPRSYAVDGGGFIYISDDKDPGIKVFDPEGRPMRMIGSKGNGPGEFQLVTSLAFLPDGRLLALDAELHRASLFGPDGRFIGSHQWTILSSSFEIYLVTDSFYVREVTTVELGKEPKTWRRHLRIPAFDFSGKEVLSFGDFEACQSGFVTGRFSFSLPFPVCSILAGDRLNRRLYHCLNDRYLIQVFDEKGKVIREIARPYKRLGVTPDDWKAYLDSFKTTAENRTAIEKNAAKPDMKSVTPYMIVDDSGRLWVQLHESKKDGERMLTAFDVFDDRGRYDCRVLSAFIPGLFHGGKMYRFETDDETGERYLKRYRVIWKD
jgi:hypothetical protein